jgi:hypothetical protein
VVYKLGGYINKRTLTKYLRNHYIRKWKVIKRILLTKKLAKNRLRFAKYWLPKIEGLMAVRGFEIIVLVGY